jgi:dihydroflavonol-4-reductase
MRRASFAFLGILVKSGEMKALVTGANGFIGSHLVRELVARGWTVSCLVRKTGRLESLGGVPVQLVTGDTRDKESLRPAVRGQGVVFHLAGAISAPDWKTYHEVNAIGTLNLVEACLEENPAPKKFVHVSSISAAGPSPPGTALREEDECKPVSDYGRSKREAEVFVLEQRDLMDVTIIRPPNVIGPRQKELADSIGLIRRRILPLVGTGRPQTSLAAVGDVVAALILAAERPESRGQIYFVTDGRAHSWREITRTVVEALGMRGPFLKVPYGVQCVIAGAVEAVARIRGKTPALSRALVRDARKYFWIYDSSKIERELGFRPSFGVSESIRQAVALVKGKGRG